MMLPTAYHPLSATIVVPGSKSISNRALLLAALSQGTSTLRGIATGDDTQVFIAALRALGVNIITDEPSSTLTVEGRGGVFEDRHVTLWCQDAGTAARFLLAAVAKSRGRYVLDGSARLCERPLSELIVALRTLGVSISSDRLPCVVQAPAALVGGAVCIEGDRSSQYSSALLMMAPLCEQGLRVNAPSLTRRAYINLTSRMMQAFGVQVFSDESGDYVPPLQYYRGCDYTIEPDLSTAAYFFAAAAVTAGRVSIAGIFRERMQQGDKQFLTVLEQMGCCFLQTHEGLSVQGPGQLQGVSVDMRDFSDTFMALAAIAPFAQGKTSITGLEHTRFQESDRVVAIAQALSALGARLEFGQGWITVYPSSLKACTVESYHDHRIAMALSLVGLRVPGILLQNATCVSKTCPDFFQILKAALHSSRFE